MFRTTLDVCGKRAIGPSASVFVLGWFEVIVVQYCCVLPIDVVNVVVLELRRMRSSSRDQHESNVGRPGVGPASLSRSVVCPKDWECHICGLNVFKWESSCFRCGGEVWVAHSLSLSVSLTFKFTIYITLSLSVSLTFKFTIYITLSLGLP